MTRLLAGIVAVCAFLSAATAAAPTTQPQHRQFSADEQQVVAAVLSAEAPLWRHYKLFFISQHEGKAHVDVPPSVVELAAAKGVTFKEFSACVYGADLRFLDRKTDAQGCVAEIDSVERKDAETYFVRGGIYSSAWRGGGFQWMVVKEDGRWVAKRREGTWVS